MLITHHLYRIYLFDILFTYYIQQVPALASLALHPDMAHEGWLQAVSERGGGRKSEGEGEWARERGSNLHLCGVFFVLEFARQG